MENELEINLSFATRQELEEARTDYIRFTLPEDFATKEDLRYFHDEHLRRLFVKVFFDKPENIAEVLEEAVSTYPRSRHRIVQITDYILRKYVKGGKLII